MLNQIINFTNQELESFNCVQIKLFVLIAILETI